MERLTTVVFDAGEMEAIRRALDVGVIVLDEADRDLILPTADQRREHQEPGWSPEAWCFTVRKVMPEIGDHDYARYCTSGWTRQDLTTINRYLCRIADRLMAAMETVPEPFFPEVPGNPHTRPEAWKADARERLSREEEHVNRGIALVRRAWTLFEAG